ncbi:curli assembly protein CsgF [Aureimonas ureilytica]|uniref:curli assembly protein CsgF n=1 Tax=Aureimonas ureilytica TaxID=401562 RepID=UPI0019D4710A|nr:curli assembly protein CsgF [Aureimonas ureilytica]
MSNLAAFPEGKAMPHLYLKSFVLLSVTCLCLGPALAGDLVYTPINPSFGGNPLNSSHLLSIAGAQKNATASDYKKPVDTSSTTGSGLSNSRDSDADLFVRQLQGRLLSALASQVTDAIFGQNPQDNGTVQFGDTKVTFERTLTSIRLRIENSTDGTVTDIVVPQLVTSSPTTTASTGISSTGTSSTGTGTGTSSRSSVSSLLNQSALTPLGIN